MREYKRINTDPSGELAPGTALHFYAIWTNCFFFIVIVVLLPVEEKIRRA